MINLIIVDSVSALEPESEINEEKEDQTIWLHIRFMSKGLRIIQGIISKYKITIFSNKISEKLVSFLVKQK